MTESPAWTIGRLLQWTTDYLKKSGSASPRLDAEVLLSDARGCQRIQLYTAFEEDPGETVRTRFRELVKRRAAGEPVAYLVGRREFYSLMFQVTPDVLIPRPETEFLVLGVLDALQQQSGDDRVARVADVGTGSGAVAVSVARHAPACRVVATDISPSALNVARRNAATHGVADRIDFLECDLFAAVPEDWQFDVIASNPPYVAAAEYDALGRDVREFEPRSALVAGQRGTEVIERLIAAAAGRLVPGGSLLMEISPMIEARVRELLHRETGWGEPHIAKDLAGLPRVIRTRHVATNAS